LDSKFFTVSLERKDAADDGSGVLVEVADVMGLVEGFSDELGEVGGVRLENGLLFSC